jgi:heptaprenylglyceryl phosphate synthase
VSVDNYGLTLVELKNVGHQDDPWVLADCVAQVFYVLDLETMKHVVVSGKQKFVGVENVEDNDKDVNQFEEMPLFTNPMNIKHIEKDFDKNLMPCLRKGGNGKFVLKLCITFHINVAIYLYTMECVSYFVATKFLSPMPYIDLVFCSSCHIDRSYTAAR